MKIIAICICLLLTMQSKNCFAQSCPNYLIYAETLKGSGNYLGAIAEYNKAIKEQPKNAEYCYRRGKIYVLMANYALAIEDFDKTIALRPEYYGAYAETAYIYALLKDEVSAMKKYDNMIENGCLKEDSEKVKAKILSILKK
jgi:tetratricopeptide (TPR) repeat protein